MSVYDVTNETLGITHTGISTTAEIGKYSPSHKGTELESNFSFTLSSIKERSLDPHKTFHPKIIEKPGHGHMR